MATHEFGIVLSAYRPGGSIDLEYFVAGLGVRELPYEIYEAGLRIGNFNLKDFGDPRARPETHDDYEKAIKTCLLKFAEWLSHIPTANMLRLRADGLQAWVIVNLWIDCDQMDFHLPPALSMELGRLDLELYVLSNE